MYLIDYAIVAAVGGIAVVVGVMVRVRLKQSSIASSEVSDIVSRYGLVKSKLGYRFGRYLAPKISEKVINEMVEVGWQYDDDKGEFTKSSGGQTDRVLISTVNALIDNMEELSKDIETMKTKVEELETKLNTRESTQPVHEKPGIVKEEVVEKKKEVIENKEPEVDVLAAFDSAKTFGELAKIWNSNPNKTMALLQPFLTSKKIIKIGKKYTINPDESA